MFFGNNSSGKQVSLLLSDADSPSRAPSAPATARPTTLGRAATAGRHSGISLSHRPNFTHSLSSSAALGSSSTTVSRPSRSSPPLLLPPPSLSRCLSSTEVNTRSNFSRTWSCSSSHASRTSDPSSSSSATPPSSAETSPRLKNSSHRPRTVPLARNDSNSSAQSSDSSRSGHSLSTPPPMTTPIYNFDPLDQTKRTTGSYPSSISHADAYLRAAAANGPYFDATAGVAAIAPQSMAPLAPYYDGNAPVGAAAATAPLVMENSFALSPPSQYPIPTPFPFPAAPEISSQTSALPATMSVPLQTPSLVPAPISSAVLASQASPSTTTLSPTSPITPTLSKQTSTDSGSSTNVAPAAGSDASASGPAEAKQIKKKYPCPHAARFGCAQSFTTSGHAARHSKRHTGEKNVICPTCHKAFTRKDNLRQHERTHRQNRDSATSVSTANSASKTAAPPTTAITLSASTSPISPSAALARAVTSGTAFAPPAPAPVEVMKPASLLAAAGHLLDQPLPCLTGPTASLSLGDVAGPDLMDLDLTAAGRTATMPGLATVNRLEGGSPSEGGSPLDALALAASGLS